MALLERKQVLNAGDQISELIPIVNAPTPPIGATVHGLISDLSIGAVGYEDKPVFFSVPTLDSIPQDGIPCTCIPAAYTGTEQPLLSRSCQWQLDAVDVPLATNYVYLPITADVTKTLRAKETLVTAGGSTVAYSAGAVVIAA